MTKATTYIKVAFVSDVNWWIRWITKKHILFMCHLFVIIKIWKVSSQISSFIIEQTIPTSMFRRNMLLLQYAMQNRFILMPMKRRILYHNIYLKIQFHKVNVICDKVIQIFIYTDIIIRLYRQARNKLEFSKYCRNPSFQTSRK